MSIEICAELGCSNYAEHEHEEGFIVCDDCKKRMISGGEALPVWFKPLVNPIINNKGG